LALMDAGVPIASPVSGIAMGIIVEGDEYKILSDIQDIEDFYGDMDFKVTGNSQGITALQLDVKNLTLSSKIMREALAQSKKGRKEILDAMLAVIPAPRPDLSEYAPKVEVIQIDPKKIGEVIGPGGKNIRRIIEETETMIDIDDDGKVNVTAESEESLKKAIAWIKGITEELEPGAILDGKVTRIAPFGAFVEVFPGKEGMVHISEIVPHRIEKVEDELSLGQEVKVKVIKIDEMGRINLTLMLDKDVSQIQDRGGKNFGPRRSDRPRDFRRR